MACAFNHLFTMPLRFWQEKIKFCIILFYLTVFIQRSNSHLFQMDSCGSYVEDGSWLFSKPSLTEGAHIQLQKLPSLSSLKLSAAYLQPF